MAATHSSTYQCDCVNETDFLDKESNFHELEKASMSMCAWRNRTYWFLFSLYIVCSTSSRLGNNLESKGEEKQKTTMKGKMCRVRDREMTPCQPSQGVESQVDATNRCSRTAQSLLVSFGCIVIEKSPAWPLFDQCPRRSRRLILERLLKKSSCCRMHQR